jgi:hypothetical protein
MNDADAVVKGRNLFLLGGSSYSVEVRLLTIGQRVMDGVWLHFPSPDKHFAWLWTLRSQV